MRVVQVAAGLFALQLSLASLNAAGQASEESRLAIGDDGWYSWRVAAHRGVGEWCCAQWNMGQPAQTGCNLDGRSASVSIMDTDRHQADQMQVYALIDNGRPAELRTLSAQCPVTAGRAIADLGTVDTDTSLDWLQQFIEPRSKLTDDVLAAISVHEGARARDTLIDIARNGSDAEQRKDAIQWLGLARIDETTDVMRQLAFEEGDSEIQEEAILALSQLPPDEAARELIAIIEKPGLHLETRRMALFSLAHTDSELVIPYFSALLAGG